MGGVSDGSHTFDELYHHRMMLFSVICETFVDRSWKSKQHHPDESKIYDDYFIVGVDTPEGQYTYHYPVEYWDRFQVTELDHAPRWDGHKPEDVSRVRSLLLLASEDVQQAPPWTQEKIEEAHYYGVNLYNSATNVPMVWDTCERCKSDFHREVLPNTFPRYCPECLTIDPNMRLNEVRGSVTI